MGRLTLAVIAGHEFKRKVCRMFPDFSCRERREIVRLAAERSFKESGERKFNTEKVLHVLNLSKHAIKRLKKDKEVFTEDKCFQGTEFYQVRRRGDAVYNVPDEDWPHLFEPETVDLTIETVDLTDEVELNTVLEDIKEDSEDDDTETECDFDQ